MPHEWIPVATASTQFFRSMGGAVFIAVAQAVFQNGLTEGIERNAPGVPAQAFIDSGASQINEVLARLNATQHTAAVLGAYMQGLRNSYFITVAGAGAAFLVTCCLSWKHIEKKRPAVAGPVAGDAEKGRGRRETGRETGGETSEGIPLEDLGEVDRGDGSGEDSREADGSNAQEQNKGRDGGDAGEGQAKP